MRADYLKLRKEEFVAAARVLGSRKLRILFKHILPNALTPIITFAPFLMTSAITVLSVLDYLGLGIPAPTASIGEMLRQGKEHFQEAWWLAVFPFLTFIGEGIRKAFDPKART
jgi:microcin C transport system permease protein